MLNDPWLTRWLPLLLSREQTHVVEIGCGIGDDTKILEAAGFAVHAFDLSPVSVAAARLRAPSATIECRDARAPFPSTFYGAGAVVSSLSLHYFPWDETQAIVSRIREVLCPGGLLLCRLNSTEDHNFGSSGHPVIEPDFYLVGGQPKRFFNEHAVGQLFQEGWKFVSKEHMFTRKYVREKAVWEVVLERSDV